MPRYKVVFDQNLSVTFHEENEGDVKFYVPCQIHYNSRDVNGSEKDGEGRVKFSIESGDAKKIFDILSPYKEEFCLVHHHDSSGFYPTISFLGVQNNMITVGSTGPIDRFYNLPALSEACPVHSDASLHLTGVADEGYDSHASAISP